MRFVSLAQRERFDIVSLCRDFGISRETGHKWLGRYREHGSGALRDLNRAPKSIPARTDPEVEALIVGERRQHPTWDGTRVEALRFCSTLANIAFI